MAAIVDLDDQLSEAVQATLAPSAVVVEQTIGRAWDVDMVALDATAGQVVSFDVDQLAGSQLDSYLRLFDSEGRQLAFSGNAAAPGEQTTKESYFRYTFTTAGRYYVGVSAQGNPSYNPLTGGGDWVGRSTGGYSLIITDVTPDLEPAPEPAPEPEPEPEPEPAPQPEILNDWFTVNLQDSDLENLARGFFTDNVLGRTDVISILAAAGSDDGVVDLTELTDLRTLVAGAGTLNMPDYVRVLAGNVVSSNVANASYQGAALGNLVAGSSATQVDKLINKWFLGLDHPAALPYGGGSPYAYRAVAGQLFVGGASLSDIDQGYVGDCYLLATLGSIAAEDPQAIQDMFLDNGDGTWTVRFFRGSTARYVTVDAMLPTTSGGTLVFAEAGSYAASASNELWVALAEKAYAQINEEGWIGQDGRNSYQGLNGGWMEVVYEQVLGQNANSYSFSSWSASSLASAFLSGTMVTFGSKTSTANGVVAGHAYVLSGYNAANQTFALYNPWGYSHVTLTWAQLTANFSALTTA